MEKTNVVKLEQKPEPFILRCTKCGATTNAPCGCGVHCEMLKPNVAAELGIQETPNESDTIIAARLNIGRGTVQRARKQLTQNGQVVEPETRVGLDGKVRRMPEPKPQFDWTPEKEAEVMRLHKEGKSDTEIAEIFGISAGAASGKKHRLMTLRPELVRMPQEMPDDILMQVLGEAAVAKTHMFHIETLTRYVDQMHEETRQAIAEEVEVVYNLSRDVIKRLVGGTRNIRPTACGVTIKVRKDD